MSFFELLVFEIKFELTVFETKKPSRKKFRALHFRHSRTLYSILITFPFFYATTYILYILHENSYFWMKKIINMPKIFCQKSAKCEKIFFESLFSGKGQRNKKMLKLTFEKFNFMKNARKYSKFFFLQTA